MENQKDNAKAKKMRTLTISESQLLELNEKPKLLAELVKQYRNNPDERIGTLFAMAKGAISAVPLEVE